MQESDLGPVNFITAISILSQAFPANMLLRYADDGYLLIPSSDNVSVPVEVGHVSRWAADCNLKMNQTKTRVGQGHMTILRSSQVY